MRKLLVTYKKTFLKVKVRVSLQTNCF